MEGELDNGEGVSPWTQLEPGDCNDLWNSNLESERRWKDSVEFHTLATRVEEVSEPCVDLTLDAKGKEFGE